MDLKNIKIYRITHIDNIPHILQYGITHRNSPLRNTSYIDIGDKSLIDNRKDKKILVDNGNIDGESIKTISLGDFTPFYFGVRMPMLYVTQQGGNFVEYATPAEEIIYIVCSVNSIISSGNECYFSDGHATDMFTSLYDQQKVDDLVQIIDWDAVTSKYWSGADNLNLKRKKQAEFLVKGDIAPKLLVGFGCYNTNAKNKLISLGIEQNMIKVIPKAYY